MIQRIKCLFGFHTWKPSRFFVLGSRGPSYQCERCKKAKQL